MSSKKRSTTKLIWENKSSNYNKTNFSLTEFTRVYPHIIYNNDKVTDYSAGGNRHILPQNDLIWGDNIDLISAMISGEYQNKIDLIYLDPPYMSHVDYTSNIRFDKNQKSEQIQRKAFSDKWKGGLDQYLQMLYIRLQMLKELLSERGSIFVHIDWHASHYIRVLMDEVFGEEFFVNEIVWCYGGGGRSRSHLLRKHDIIYWYAKSENYIFNPQYRPYTEGTIKRGLTKVKGSKYSLNKNGALLQDWWTDINKILSPTAQENLKYPTQKPKDLIKRLIAMASYPDSIVADFFAGSGTTAEVCNEMGRKWILCDNSTLALQTIIYRLINCSAKPFSIKKCEDVTFPESDADLIMEKPRIQRCNKDEVLINIRINDYRIKREEKQKSQKNCIEYWEADLNFDNSVFCSDVQVIRQTQRFGGPISLELQVLLPRQRNYRIAVRVHDIFANSTTVIQEF